MTYAYILALDPSGSYTEGKGVTGWCLLQASENKIIDCGHINAIDYDNVAKYWAAHEQLIQTITDTYKKTFVVIEDYFLYANKATQQINSRMETPQLLGILKYKLYANEIPFKLQSASEVKQRWADHILVYKKIIIPQKRGYCTEQGIVLNRHMKDAIRHAVHYNTFTNLKRR